MYFYVYIITVRYVYQQHGEDSYMAGISGEAMKKIALICDKYKNEETPLMMILSDIQNEYGYIPLEVQELVSEKTGLSVAEIYGVVTFYSFFTLKPKGKYIIGCCLGTACYVKGGEEILHNFQRQLGLEIGECTEDGMFSLEPCRCVGACGLAPVVMINDKVYGKLKPADVEGILAEYMNEQ